MPHKTKPRKQRSKKEDLVNLSITESKEFDDTPKSFRYAMQFKEMLKEKQKEKGMEKKQKNNTELKIQYGEKMRDFVDRVEMEFQGKMNDALRSSRKPSERKKRNREARKEKEQIKKRRTAEEYGGRDFDDLKDNVRFGEVADAPPIFTKIPKARGSGKEILNQKTKQAMGHDQTSQTEPQEDNDMMQLKLSHKRKIANMSGATRKILTSEREKAIASYRAQKAKKMVASGLTPV